jgi:hypothetical protein
MGRFRVTITAVGGHGCQRNVKDGGRVTGCGSATCPDCQAHRFVEALREAGSSVEAATLEHWPGTAKLVVDDLVTGVRRGSF